MIIALASPRIASTLDDGLDKIRRSLSEASAQGAEIVCFPEAYLPGLRGQDFEVLPFDQTTQERALNAVAQWARTYSIATILGTERLAVAGRQIVAFIIDAQGEIQGCQTKNQLDPTEDQFYVPGNTRQLFEISGTKFGVVICHEGWRYPETVRWAAVRGAKIVFHPHHTGSDREGVRLTEWGEATAPYYEKAMMMRSKENTIYFASVNYALRYQESATSLITPSGECQSYLPYGQEGVLVQAIDVEEATGLLAARYAPERYQEQLRAATHSVATLHNRGHSQGGNSMPAKPETIDEYLEPLSIEKRTALQKLRKDIKSAAPKAEECISYMVPGFRLDGRLLVSFGAAANHCAFYPGAHPIIALKDELKSYDTSKGTIRFPPDSPLPATLVRKIVKSRIAEYAAKQPRATKGAKRRR